MKNFKLVLFIFFFNQLTAQINNKNCPYNIDNMVRSEIAGEVVYSYIIDIYPDSTVVKNYVANSENYFDSILAKVNHKKFHIANIEYSPANTDYKKVFSYNYIRRQDKFKNNKLYYHFPTHGIGYPKDDGWLEKYFSGVLTADFYIKFF